MLYHLTLKSANIKTGPIPVTVSSNETCPSVCPLKSGSCYAKSGPLAIHWRKVSDGYRGNNFIEFCNELEKLPQNQLIRINAAGDLPGKGNRINGRQLKKLSKSLKGKNPFGYTHKPVIGGYVARQNRKHIKAVNKNGFTINLSANNLKEVDKLVKLKIGPVVVVVPEGSPKTIFTKGGNKVITCPAVYLDTNCSKCKLCSKQRNVVVAFPAHGVSKKKVNLIANCQ